MKISHPFLKIAHAFFVLTILFGWFANKKAMTPESAFATSSGPELLEGRTNTVEIRLIEAESGNTTPAMVCITNVDDGTVRLPPDGRVCRKVSRNQDFYKGIRFDRDRNWIGPVRQMAGSSADNQERAYIYKHPSLPYWNEPVMYLTSGDFSIELPKGRWRIAVSHGMEYVPVVEELETCGDGYIIQRTFELKRWIDLAKRGWYSGDTHVHHPTLEEAHREFLLQQAIAEDLHVSNILEMSHHPQTQEWKFTTEFKAAGSGEKFRTHRGEYWLIPGQEDLTIFGDLVGLNIGKLAVRDQVHYDFLDLILDQHHEKKEAVAGFPHFAWMRHPGEHPAGFAWTVTSENVDYVELLQFRRWNPRDYHDYLNLGFKLTAAAGSDQPWGGTVGEVRTYVYTGQPPLDPDLWFANLRKGHTFVTNGPALEFTVDGQLPGSEIEKPAGRTARAIAKVLGHPKVGLPKVLTIEGNDGILKEVTNPGGQSELSLEMELPIEKSQWLVASSVCTNGAVAHTSPVYVIVDGQPFWSPMRGPAIIAEKVNWIRAVEKEFAEGTDPRSKGMVKRMRKAMAYYTELKDKMEQEIDFTRLFNGRNLEGWVVKGPKTWRVEEGVLICDGAKDEGQWLRSEKEYENFVLRLEYRVIRQGGNSGMFVRATDEGDPAFTGMEVQILTDYGEEPTVHSSGALYGSVAPKRNASKPHGQWNEMEIVCDNRRLMAILNGVQILDVDLDDESLPYEEKPLHLRATKGYIGLQDHGDPVQFRNILLAKLP